MAKAIMILGTASNVGKSTVTAFLCRYFYNKGYKVAPFKSQNISDISFETKDGHLMSHAQALQAEACNIEPDYRMNPVLIKPTFDKEKNTFESEIILNGVPFKKIDGYSQKDIRDILLTEIEKAYKSLSEEYDYIIIEGAGSCAEINLVENDTTNIAIAKIANAPCLLVGDIDRGGVFASIYGTYMLQTDEDKNYIKGTIINKFSGKLDTFTDATKMLENLIKIPCVAIFPNTKIDIAPEDILAINEMKGRTDFSNDFDGLVKSLEQYANVDLIEKIMEEGM